MGWFRKKVLTVATIISIMAGFPKQTRAEYVAYLKTFDPNNIVLEVQKEANELKRKLNETMEAIELEDTKFLQFQFDRLENICAKIDVKNHGQLVRADSIINQIAKEILVMTDSVASKVDLKKLIRYKLHKECKELEKIDKKRDWQTLVQRSYGLKCMAEHLGDKQMFRKIKRLWEKYQTLLTG